MNWMHAIYNNQSLKDKFINFLSLYGLSGLEQAIQLYTDMQQDYICKTKSSITRLKISEIYYLTINQHTIIAHTNQNTYQKYGSLNNELKLLSHYGFIKCSQNCVVSLSKIQSISGNQITLNNQEVLHISRKYASDLLMAFYNSPKKEA